MEPISNDSNETYDVAIVMPLWYNIIMAANMLGTAFVVIFGIVLMTSILSTFFEVRRNSISSSRSKPLNVQSYNMYLLFVIFPDVLYNLIRLISYIVYVSLGNKYAPGMAHALYWAFTFFFLGNFWLNAIIAYHIFVLSKRSYRRMKTSPPAMSRVLKEVVCVYTITALISTWHVLPDSVAPTTMENSEQYIIYYGSELVSQTVALGIALGLLLIPLIYVTYVAVSLWARNLLPIRGRARALSLYFLRIVLTFYVFFLPQVILSAVYQNTRNNDSSEGLHYISSAIVYWLVIFQALTTMNMTMQKPDIKTSVKLHLNSMLGLICKNKKELKNDNTDDIRQTIDAMLEESEPEEQLPWKKVNKKEESTLDISVKNNINNDTNEEQYHHQQEQLSGSTDKWNEETAAPKEIKQHDDEEHYLDNNLNDVSNYNHYEDEESAIQTKEVAKADERRQRRNRRHMVQSSILVLDESEWDAEDVYDSERRTLLARLSNFISAKGGDLIVEE